MALSLAFTAAGFLILFTAEAFRSARTARETRAGQSAVTNAVVLESAMEVARAVTEAVVNNAPAALLDPDRCRPLVMFTRDALPIFAGVSVVDSTGALVCSALPIEPGVPPSAKNPMDSPSGEKNGPTAPREFGRGEVSPLRIE